MKRLLFILSTLSVLFVNAQTDSIPSVIKSKLTQYPAFKDCQLDVKPDSASNGLYKVDISYGGKTIPAETFKKDNEWLVVFDAKKEFITDLLKDNVGELDSLELKKGMFLITNKAFTIKYSELPTKYQVQILKKKKPEDGYIDYELPVEKGFNIIGEATSTHLRSILKSSPNSGADHRLLINTSLGTDMLGIITKVKTASKSYLQGIKINLFAYNYFQTTGFYTVAPINFIFELGTMGFAATLQTTVHVNNITFFGLQKEDFLVKGHIQLNPEFNLPEIELTGMKPFSKSGILSHIPAIKLTDLGVKIGSFPDKEKNGRYILNFNFIGKVNWGSNKHEVVFPKDGKGNYKIEFNSLPLSKFYPNFNSTLLTDLFNDITLKNVFLSETYFDAKLPFNGALIDITGFKLNNNKEYNLAFNFPNLDIKDLVSHEAGFSFPNISLPHNVVAFYIPEINLTGSSGSSKTFKIPSLTSIPSIKFQSFFKDEQGNDFPKNGFELSYGLSFEHFDLSLDQLFGDQFPELDVKQYLGTIKLRELNITSKTISCKFPIAKGINVDLIAFKMPNSPKMNLIFQLEEFKFSDYINGISSTPLADISIFKNIKFIGIPSFTTSSSMAGVETAEKVSFKWADLPDIIKFSFPEYEGGSRGSLDFSVGFNFSAPAPTFSGDLKTFFEAIGNPKLPAFKGKINPKFLFQNWGSWNMTASSSNPPAKNNPQVQDSPEFRDDFMFGEIPLPEFSAGNFELKDPKLSIDGLKFDFPLTIDASGHIVKSGKKFLTAGEWATLITANIELDMPDDKKMNLHDTRILLDKQNKALRFKTIVSQDSLIYGKNDEGKEELKETVPTTLFSAENMSITKIGFDALYNYESKNAFGNINGSLFLTLKGDKKHFDFDAKLHYNNQEKTFTPLFHIFSNDGISFADFNNLDLPSPLPQINHLKVYDLEVAENYFFLGFSPENTIEQNLDSSDYIMAFKAKGQAKYNFGAKTSHLITTLLQDAPSIIRTDNFSSEKFIFVPVGNDIKDLTLEGYPEKIIQHFNPSGLPKINLTAGKMVQANYTGDIDISDFKLSLNQVPVGFNISSTSSGNNNAAQDGMEIKMVLPDFTFEGIDFKSDTMILAKEAGRWNTTMHTQISFEYEGNEMVFKVDAEPFKTDTAKGINFSTTNNMVFQLPEAMNYATYDSVMVTGRIERIHEVTSIALSGNLHLGSKTYTTTAELLKKDGKFKDIVFKITNDAIQLADIPEINKLPDADKISIKNPEISLHHIAGEIQYENFNTSGVVFREGTSVALILGFDDFGLQDIVKDIPSDFKFGQTTVALSSATFSKKVSDLPVAVYQYFNKTYSDNDEVKFPAGISLFTKFNPSKIGGDVGSFFGNIGMTEDFVVSGGLGANLSGITNFTLYVSPKNEIKTSGNFAFISDIKDPKFYISYQPGILSMGLEAKTHFIVDKEKLDFQMKLGLDYAVSKPTAIKMQSSMIGKWHNPMGMDGISFTNVTMGIDGDVSGGFDIDFKGTLGLKSSDSLFLAASIPANGNLTHFGICATATKLSLEDYAEIADALSGGKLHVEDLPLDILSFKDVELAFVPPFASIQCSNRISGIQGGGVALKGKAELGGPDFGGTYEISSIDATAGILSGLSVQGNLNDVDLDFASINDSNLDIVAKLENGKPKTHFKLNGNMMLLGIEQGIEMVLSPDNASFTYSYEIDDLCTGDVTAVTTDGLKFNSDNTMVIEAELKGDLKNDFLASLGTEVANALKVLGDGYETLKTGLNSAISVVNEKEDTVAKVRNIIIKERQKVEDELKTAQWMVGNLRGQIQTAKVKAGDHYDNSKNGCRRSHKSCWHSFWGKKYCYTFHWIDYGCRVKEFAEYLYYKSEQYSLEAAKYAADKVLEAIIASIDFVPIEADPRMAVPLAELETAKGIMNLALAALEGAQHANDDLVDLADSLKTPDLIEDNFYLKEVKMTGGLNAFQTQGNEVDFQLQAKVFGKDIETAFSVNPHNVSDVKDKIIEALTDLSNSKTNSIKEKNSKEHYYQPSSPATLTFDWKKINGFLKDISATDNNVYGIGTDNKLWILSLADSTWSRVNNIENVFRIDAKGTMVYMIGGDGHVLEYNETTGAWHRFPHGSGYDVAVDKDGSVWVVGRKLPVAALYQTKDRGQTWHKLAAKAKRLDIDSKGHKYHVGGDNQIWDSDNNKLVRKGFAKDIFVLDDDIWIQSQENNTWLYESHLYQDYIRANGKTMGLAKLNGKIYSINAKDNTVWIAEMPEQFSGWERKNIKMLDVASNSSGIVWGVGTNYHAYKYNEVKDTWEDYGGTIKKIAVQENGIPLGISAVAGKHNQIVTIDLSSKEWHDFPVNKSSNAYDINGIGWHIGADGYTNGDNKGSTIWKYDPSNKSFKKSNGIGIRLSYDGTSKVYLVGGDHKIYYKDKESTANWTEIPSWAHNIAIDPRGNVWHIGKSHNPWYGNPGDNYKWKETTGKLKAIAFTNKHIIGIGMDDNIWRIKY